MRLIPAMLTLVRHEAIFQHMSTIVCGDDPELKNGKPAPDIYLLAAHRLNVDPKDCLVFDDAMVSRLPVLSEMYCFEQ